MNKFYYTNEQMENDLVELTRQMARDGFCPDIIIGPGRGAYIPGVMLSHYYEVPFEGFTWQTRDGGTQDTIALDKVIFSYIRDGIPANVLIIDDVNDSGKTLIDITDQTSKHINLWPSGLPIIKIATLFNKDQSIFQGVDYSARTLTPDYDPWIVFPYEEWWNPK